MSFTSSLNYRCILLSCYLEVNTKYKTVSGTRRIKVFDNNGLV